MSITQNISDKDIHEFPRAFYYVKLVFDYMVVSTGVSLDRIEDEDEDSLTDRVVEKACEFLNEQYGVDFMILGIIDTTIEVEGFSR